MAFIVIGVFVAAIALMLLALFAVTAIMHDTDMNDLD
jgi:hypothetical protein